MYISRHVHALRALLIIGKELSASPRHRALQCNGAMTKRRLDCCLQIWPSLPPEAKACCTWDLGLLLARSWLRSLAGALTGWCCAAAGAVPALRWHHFSGLQSQCWTQREGRMDVWQKWAELGNCEGETFFIASVNPDCRWKCCSGKSFWGC